MVRGEDLGRAGEGSRRSRALSVVFATSETYRSCPSPLMWMSNLPLNLPKWRQLIRSASSAGVSTSVPKAMPRSSQRETASNVSERKTLPEWERAVGGGRWDLVRIPPPRAISARVALPFDQLNARGSAACSLPT